MKRILEVLQDGDGQLKFRTDINVWKEPMASMDIIQNAMLSMSTTLWGRKRAVCPRDDTLVGDSGSGPLYEP